MRLNQYFSGAISIEDLKRGLDSLIYEIQNVLNEKADLVGADFTGSITIDGDITASGSLIVSGNSIFGSLANNTAFDNTGHQTMVGTARPWRDELTDAIALQQQGPGVSRNNTEGTVDFAYNASYNATFSSADAMFLNIQLNHDKDLTASIYPHIHWVQEKNYSPNFLLEYRWQKNGGTKTTAWTKLKCNTLTYTYSSGSLNQISYAPAIAVPVGTALSDIVQFRIFRDTTNASALFTGNCPYNTGGNATASVLAFDCHFMINSIGSNDEYTK
jgi:hypothetical protein